jgi:hypothetical protein
VKGRDAIAVVVARPLAPVSYQRIQGIVRPEKELAPGPAHGQEGLDCTASGRGCFEYVITNVPARARLPMRIAKAAIAIHDLTLEDAFDRRHQFLRNRVGCSLVLDASGWCRSRVSAWAGPRPSSPDQKGTGDCACAKEETHHEIRPTLVHAQPALFGLESDPVIA